MNEVTNPQRTAGQMRYTPTNQQLIDAVAYALHSVGVVETHALFAAIAALDYLNQQDEIT